MTQLIEKVCEDSPDLDMYLNSDQGIVCREFDDENWNNNLNWIVLKKVPVDQQQKIYKRRWADDEPFQPKIKTLTKAIDLLEQTQYFLDFSGYEPVANEVGAVIDKIVL